MQFQTLKIRRRMIRTERLFSKNKAFSGGRSELNGDIREPRSPREWVHWLLWAGISPEAGKPMSFIGIYTDFT